MSSIDKISVGGVDFDITSSPTPVMAPVETGTTATQTYAVGDYVIVGSTLHAVTAAIAIGDTFTEGTNISTSTSLGDEITQLNNDLTATYDKSLNKWFERNSDGTRGQEIKVGGNMKVLKYGTITSTTTVSLGVTLDPSKYIVLISTSYSPSHGDTTWGGNNHTAHAWGQGAWWSNKTSTSVKINVAEVTASYEIIQIAD